MEAHARGESSVCWISVALQLRKRRKFEPDQPFIRKDEPGQNLSQLRNTTLHWTPMGFTGCDWVALGKPFMESDKAVLMESW